MPDTSQYTFTADIAGVFPVFGHQIELKAGDVVRGVFSKKMGKYISITVTSGQHETVVVGE